MKKMFLALLALATALAISPVASAQDYDFSFTGVGSGPYVGDAGSGIVDVSGGQIVAITGTFNGYAMSLAAVGGFGSNDNLYFPPGTPSYFDVSGLTFEANGIYYNLFSLDGTTYIEGSDTGTGKYTDPQSQVAFTDSVLVPEGGSSLLYLLLVSASCFGFMFFGSRNRLATRMLA